MNPYDLTDRMYIVYILGEDNKPRPRKEFFSKQLAENYSREVLSSGRCSWIEEVVVYDNLPF